MISTGLGVSAFRGGAGKLSSTAAPTAAPSPRIRSPMRWLARGLSMVARAIRRGLQDDVVNAAAALAYYFLFAMFPLLLFLAALLHTAHLSGLEQNIVAGISRGLPRAAATLVSLQLRQVLARPSAGLFSVGVALTLYSASMGFSGLIAGLNRAYEAAETRSFGRVLLLALGLTVSSGILVVFGLALLLLGQHLWILFTGRMPMGGALALLWPFLRWAATACFFILAIALLYRAAPNLPRRGRPLWPGALFAFVLWMIISSILVWYLDNLGNYAAVYGSLAAVIALMLWFYFLALALLLGAEFDQQVAKRRAAR